MSRWIIEKSGTGIEKSGTGIEKSGTGFSKAGISIEKAGTGIEKSGTGIEKSGTGIRRALLALSLAAFFSVGNVSAGQVDPAGSLQVVVQDNTVAVSWIIGDSVFSGVSRLTGSYASLMLTEIALADRRIDPEVTGNGTGFKGKVTGNGTGISMLVTGNGTGAMVTGNGTGAMVTGNGTGALVTGNGTGALVTGNGTGVSSLLVTGNGTGSESITITLPEGTGLSMEISIGCGAATVAIVDEYSTPIVEFTDVPLVGGEEICGGENLGEFNDQFSANPGADFDSRGND